MLNQVQHKVQTNKRSSHSKVEEEAEEIEEAEADEIEEAEEIEAEVEEYLENIKKLEDINIFFDFT